MSHPPLSKERDEIRAKGYHAFPGVLDGPMLDEIRSVTDGLVDDFLKDPQAGERFKFQGTNIPYSYQHSALARLIAWPRTLQVFNDLGYGGVKFWNGYILSKPPGAPPLYWHQDWPFWSDPITADPDPAMMFAMYYLTDTSPQNGCLRVIPGSHRKRLPFHDVLPPPHTAKANTTTYDPNSPFFLRHPEEVDVKVKAGDLVVGDARVLHSAHANGSVARRTCLTLWYLPTFDRFSAGLRLAFKKVWDTTPPPSVPAEDRALLDSIRMPTDTPAGVDPVPFDRVPGVYLR